MYLDFFILVKVHLSTQTVFIKDEQFSEPNTRIVYKSFNSTMWSILMFWHHVALTSSIKYIQLLLKTNQYGFIMTEIHFYFYNYMKFYFSHIEKSSPELRGAKSLFLWSVIKYVEEISKIYIHFQDKYLSNLVDSWNRQI